MLRPLRRAVLSVLPCRSLPGFHLPRPDRDHADLVLLASLVFPRGPVRRGRTGECGVLGLREVLSFPTRSPPCPRAGTVAWWGSRREGVTRAGEELPKGPTVAESESHHQAVCVPRPWRLAEPLSSQGLGSPVVAQRPWQGRGRVATGSQGAVSAAVGSPPGAELGPGFASQLGKRDQLALSLSGNQ